MTDNFFDRNGTIQSLANVVSAGRGSEGSQGWFRRFGNSLLSLIGFI